jgi:hypothetical protein
MTVILLPGKLLLLLPLSLFIVMVLPLLLLLAMLLLVSVVVDGIFVSLVLDPRTMVPMLHLTPPLHLTSTPSV